MTLWGLDGLEHQNTPCIKSRFSYVREDTIFYCRILNINYFCILAKHNIWDHFVAPVKVVSLFFNVMLARVWRFLLACTIFQIVR